MTRSNSIILAAFILVLSAGVVLGRLWAELPVVNAAGPGHPPPSWLAQQLDLSPQQRQEMDAIWANVRQQLDKAGDRRAQLDREREQAVLALLSPEQRQAYDKIIADFRFKRAALEQERRELINSADQRSQALLDDQQKQKWVELRNSHEWHGGHGPNGPGPGGPGGLGGGPPPLPGMHGHRPNDASTDLSEPVTAPATPMTATPMTATPATQPAQIQPQP